MSMGTIGLSIEEWSRLAAAGTRIPVEITLAGNSMEPLIRKGRDTVVIIPMDREPVEGDVVLFQRADGAYVVHRVYKVTGDRVVTLGDNCENPDPPIGKDRVLGLVTKIRRGSRIIEADSEKQRRAGKLGMKLLPLRKRVLHLKYVIRKNLGRSEK